MASRRGSMLAVLLLALGCDPVTPGADAGSPPADAPSGDVTAPELLRVTLTETPANVLAYVLEVETDEPAAIRVDVDGPGGAFTRQSTTFELAASLWIGGLRPESVYELTVIATDASGNVRTDGSLSIETRALPADFPPITVRTVDPERVAEGYTLFNVFQWPAGERQPARERSWLVALDASGAVVWYYVFAGMATDARLLDNGRVLFLYDEVGLIELEPDGTVARHVVATGAGHPLPEGAIRARGIEAIHHEASVLPNGNYLVLSTERRTITSAQCPEYAAIGDALEVIGDELVELDPASGEVVARVSTFDDLDPCRRIDRGFEAGFWNAHYGGATTQDWTHANAAYYDAGEGLVFVSVRHADWIVAYRWEPGGGGATGEVAWVLGDEGEAGDYGTLDALTPTGAGPFAWPYHQHAPEGTPAGTLLVFDNGNLRPGTNFDPDDAMGDADLPYSRVVEYAYDTSAADPSAWTVEQVWEWAPADPATRYAPFVGDVDALPNGNVLMTFGGVVDPPSDALGDPDAKKRARLIEVTRGGGEEVIVLDVEVVDPAASDFDGYTVYRAERVPEGFLR